MKMGICKKCFTVMILTLIMQNGFQKTEETVNLNDNSFYIQCIQNLSQGNNIAYADGYYYFRSQTENYCLCRKKESGDMTEVIAEATPNEICIREETVYFINASDGQSFYSVGTDGSNLSKISDGPMKNMIIIGDTVFFLSVYEKENDPFYQLVEEETAVTDSCLCSMKLDGSDKRILVPEKCLEFTSDGKKLYYSIYDKDAGENGEYIIYECGSDGTEERIRNKNQTQIYNLVSYKGNLYGYIIEDNKYEIIQINQNSDLQVLMTDMEKRFVTISENNMYFYDNCEICKYNLETKEKQAAALERSGEADDHWDNPYCDRGIFIINGKLFVKYSELNGKGILWHVWNEEKEDFTVFEDMEELDPEKLVKDTSIEYELNFYHPGKDDPLVETFLDGELTCHDSYFIREDGAEFGTFDFSLPLFNSGVRGYRKINQTMRELMEKAMETRDSYFQDLEEEEGEFSMGHLDFSYSRLYVGEKYVSMFFNLNGYTGGMRAWEEALPLTFDRDTGELLTMDDLFTVDRNHYMKRLTDAVYKYCEIKEYSWWQDSFDNNVLVKNFEPNWFYLTPDGIVLCYSRYSVQMGACGDPKYEIPYSWFEDIFKDS